MFKEVLLTFWHVVKIFYIFHLQYSILNCQICRKRAWSLFQCDGYMFLSISIVQTNKRHLTICWMYWINMIRENGHEEEIVLGLLWHNNHAACCKYSWKHSVWQYERVTHCWEFNTGSKVGARQCSWQISKTVRFFSHGGGPSEMLQAVNC